MKYILILMLFALNALKAQIELSTSNILFYQYNANECKFDVTEVKKVDNIFRIEKEKIKILSKGKLFSYMIVKDYLKEYVDKKAWYTEHNEKIIYYIGKSVMILYYNYNEKTHRYDNYMIFYN